VLPHVPVALSAADEEGMRRSVVTTLVALAAGLAARAVLRRFADRRRPAAVTRATAVARAAAPAAAPAAPIPDPARDAVVLPFAPRVVTASAPERPAAPARCGDSGGRTKAGAPCGARAASDGRCRHHRLAA
jgi:hypothetical protein